MKLVRLLGLCFVGLGMVEVAWVLFCLFGGLLLGGAAAFGPKQPELWLGLGAYWLLALVNTPIALLHLLAGFRLRGGRGLYLTMAAIAACMPAMIFALYCSPLVLPVMVFGIVVLILPESRKVLDPFEDDDF